MAIEQDATKTQAAEGRSLIAKNFEPQQINLYNSDISVPVSAPVLTHDEWRRVWVTMQWRLCKTAECDEAFADLKRICDKIKPILAEGFGS